MLDDRKIKSCFFYLSSIIYHLSSAPQAHAGAWTQPQGTLQLITTALYYQADERFDTDGNKVAQPTYTKYELNPYLEYGLTDSLTLGANIFLQHLNDSSDSTYGLGDSEIFARQRLWQSGRFVLSVQPEIKLPSPLANERDTPAIGSKHLDYGARAIGGINFDLFGQSHYAELDAGYRHRGGEPEDQILLNGTLGLRVNDQILLLPQVFQTIRADSALSPAFTQSPRDDYTLTKAQLSAVYRWDENYAVQLGAFQHISGRNAGAGGGALLALWTEF